MFSCIRPGRRRHVVGRRRGGANRGAAVVEFAVVSPVLFLVIFGIIEFGRLFMVQQVLTNASREGARRAILEQSTSTEVETVVTDYLASSRLESAAVTVDPANIESLVFGDPVTVSVSVPFDEVSWVPSPWFLGGRTLSAQTIMRAERPQ